MNDILFAQVDPRHYKQHTNKQTNKQTNKHTTKLEGAPSRAQHEGAHQSLQGAHLQPYREHRGDWLAEFSK